jgi:hypothetical protein
MENGLNYIKLLDNKPTSIKKLILEEEGSNSWLLFWTIQEVKEIKKKKKKFKMKFSIIKLFKKYF